MSECRSYITESAALRISNVVVTRFYWSKSIGVVTDIDPAAGHLERYGAA